MIVGAYVRKYVDHLCFHHHLKITSGKLGQAMSKPGCSKENRQTWVNTWSQRWGEIARSKVRHEERIGRGVPSVFPRDPHIEAEVW